MRLRSIILAFAGCVLLAALPGAARSQPIQGFYIDAGAGLRMPFPPKATSLEPGVPGTIELREGLGFDTQFAAGYALGDGWRFELEANYGRSSINSVAKTPYPAAAAGSVRNLGVMANALFDLDVRSPYIYPYLGLGFGYQSTRLNGFSNTPIGRPGSVSASGTAGAPATQIIGGLSFPIPNMPGLSITVDYRVMDILGGEKFAGGSSIGLPAGSAPLAGTIKLHNQFNQSVMFGVRYAFDTPPPPPPEGQGETPTPPEAQLFEVPFETNTATLTRRGQAVLRNAALLSTHRRSMRIAVSGGSVNSGLIGRRAQVVMAALVAEGVPRRLIALDAAGDPGGAPYHVMEIVTQ